MRNLEIIPVIHVKDLSQAEANIVTCINASIGKVMLIHMSGYDDATLLIYERLKIKYPSLWIGCNLLSTGNTEAMRIGSYCDGLWTDKTVTARDHNFKGLLFGGVAFKYQKQPLDLVDATIEATKHVDVITTSGIATGKAVDVSKLEVMRNAMGGDHLFAVASGVSESNIGSYRGLLDFVLVATSITGYVDGVELIDPVKLDRLQSNNK